MQDGGRLDVTFEEKEGKWQKVDSYELKRVADAIRSNDALLLEMVLLDLKLDAEDSPYKIGIDCSDGEFDHSWCSLNCGSDAAMRKGGIWCGSLETLKRHAESLSHGEEWRRGMGKYDSVLAAARSHSNDLFLSLHRAEHYHFVRQQPAEARAILRGRANRERVMASLQRIQGNRVDTAGSGLWPKELMIAAKEARDLSAEIQQEHHDLVPNCPELDELAVMLEAAAEHRSLWVHPSKAGLVIGSKGRTIRALQEETGCRISLDEPKHRPGFVFTNEGYRDKFIALQGTRENVARARDRITEIVGGGLVTEEMPVPAEAVGAIVGSKGATIRALQAETRCQINLNSRTRQYVEGPLLTLQGEREAVEAAKARIHGVVAGVAAQGRGGRHR